MELVRMSGWLERLDVKEFFFSILDLLHIPKYRPFSEHFHNGNSLLMLEDAIPAPHLGAGFPRSYQMLLMLEDIGFKVTLFPLVNQSCKGAKALRRRQIDVLCGSHLDFLQFAKRRSGFYKVIVISRPHNFKKVKEIIRTYFPDAYLIYDAEALFSIREILKERVTGNISAPLDQDKMIREEIDLMRSADLVLAVSGHEMQVIRTHGYEGKIQIWGYPLIPYQPLSSFSEREGILFLGSFLARESPNEDAILYFLSDIYPKVREKTHCSLCIAGYNPPATVQKYSSSTIAVTGYVKDISQLYQQFRVFIVPHRYSAGIPLKLLEAMSHGMPAVVSPHIAEQLELKDGEEVRVAETPEDFAEAICKLYQDEVLWTRIQNNAINYILEHCNPAVLKDALKDITVRKDDPFLYNAHK